MKTICLGKIIKPFGLDGVLRCKSLTSFAKSRFHLGRKLILLNEKTNEIQDVEVSYFRDSGDYYFVGFSGMEDINIAEKYIGWSIEIPEEDAPIPEGYYRLKDLIGCKVVDSKANEEIGEVIDVMTFSSSSNFKVKETNGKICYIPFVMNEFIVSLNLDEKKIIINVIPGLL